MKELTNIIKEYHTFLIDTLTDIESKYTKTMKKMKKEIKNTISNEKYKLLVKICEDEKLNLEKMKVKYLNSTEVKNLSDELLDVINYNDTEYYLRKSTNEVIDVDNNIVGLYINNQIEFTN